MASVKDDPRKVLTDILSELLDQNAALQAHLRNEGRLPDQREDWMNIIENDEVVEFLDQRTLDRIRAVLAALDRVDKGTYGRSVKSGTPIEPERLEAIPWATLTIDEARQEEGAGVRPAAKGAAAREQARSLEPGEPEVGEHPGPTNALED